MINPAWLVSEPGLFYLIAVIMSFFIIHYTLLWLSNPHGSDGTLTSVIPMLKQGIAFYPTRSDRTR
jgi:hypothetical protein